MEEFYILSAMDLIQGWTERYYQGRHPYPSMVFQFEPRFEARHIQLYKEAGMIVFSQIEIYETGMIHCCCGRLPVPVAAVPGVKSVDFYQMKPDQTRCLNICSRPHSHQVPALISSHHQSNIIIIMLSFSANHYS